MLFLLWIDLEWQAVRLKVILFITYQSLVPLLARVKLA